MVEKSMQLDQFLKVNNLVATGGQAKILIQSGQVKLNGLVETRRKKKLRHGDVIELLGQTWTVDDDQNLRDPTVELRTS